MPSGPTDVSLAVRYAPASNARITSAAEIADESRIFFKRASDVRITELVLHEAGGMRKGAFGRDIAISYALNVRGKALP